VKPAGLGCQRQLRRTFVATPQDDNGRRLLHGARSGKKAGHELCCQTQYSEGVFGIVRKLACQHHGEDQAQRLTPPCALRRVCPCRLPLVELMTQGIVGGGLMSERDHTVMVWGRPCTVSVYRKSKTVWVATGAYMGESITVQDRSEGTALKRWREAATYKGNG